MAIFGLIGYFDNGYLMRNNLKSLPAEFALAKGNPGLVEGCVNDSIGLRVCRNSDAPEVVLWGDSFAQHLEQGLMASKPSLKFAQITNNGCGPLFDAVSIGNDRDRIDWAPQCVNNNQKVLEYLRKTPSIRYVVISSPFTRYAELDHDLLLSDGRVKPSDPYGLEIFLETLGDNS